MRALLTSRRGLIGAGAAALAATAARADADDSTSTEAMIRRWYKLWEGRDWAPFDAILSESFTFSSAADDDHISKAAFKTKCWGTQKDLIGHFDIVRLFAKGDEAFAQYVCHLVNGKTISNVEFFQLKNGRIEFLDCYFGGRAGYPTATNAAKS
jgi:hypothetical protein